MSGSHDAEKRLTVEEWEARVRDATENNRGTAPMTVGPYFREDKRVVRLPDAARAESPADTEALLNGLIEDCRFLIKEVIFHSARLTPDPESRLRFLSSAETLAVTGAKVGRTIADLRGGAAPAVEEDRYRMIVEHVWSIPPAAIELPAPKGRGRGKGKSA
jgi:hypothetical protein